MGHSTPPQSGRLTDSAPAQPGDGGWMHLLSRIFFQTWFAGFLRSGVLQLRSARALQAMSLFVHTWIYAAGPA